MKKKPLTKKELRSLAFGKKASDICLGHNMGDRKEYLSDKLARLFREMERK